MFFMDLTQANGQPLDIPAFSVMLVEELDDNSKKESGAESGLFFDLGNGLQSSVVKQSFDEVFAMIAERAGEFVRLQTAAQKPLLVMKSSVIGLRGLSEEDKLPGKTQLTLRVGDRPIVLHVLETRDEIREKIDG